MREKEKKKREREKGWRVLASPEPTLSFFYLFIFI